MKFSRRMLAREVLRLIKENPARRAHIIKQAAAFLINNKQDKYSHLFINEIANELERSDAHIRVELLSARPLSSSIKSNITKMLKSKTGAKTIEINEDLDPKLLGGLIVRTPKFLLDTSVRNQLNRLKGIK